MEDVEPALNVRTVQQGLRKYAPTSYDATLLKTTGLKMRWMT